MSLDPRTIRGGQLVADTDSDSGADQNPPRALLRGRDASSRRLSIHTPNPNHIFTSPTHELELLAGRRASWAPALPPRPASRSGMSSGSSPTRNGHGNSNTGNANHGRTGRRSSNNSPSPIGRVRRGSRGPGTQHRTTNSHSSSTPRTNPHVLPLDGSGYGSGHDSSGPPTPSLPAFQLNFPSSSNLLIRRASNLNNLATALPPDPSSHHHPLHANHNYHPAQPSNLQSHQFSGDVQSSHALGSSTSALAGEPSSPPDDGENFKKSLQIDMKGLVGDAVGNMCISPSSRDVVLAARRGLFIIDLEAPLEVPRFLPQGGTWDVADVQWNPHSARAEYIVSTSSEKLLIWNLLLNPKSKTSIEHILHAHYRAVTDTNWHTSECDVVASTGIDSWIWGWDLRVGEGGCSPSNSGRGGRRPVFGLCAFNSGGTQVRWNRANANILASSHSNEVLVWDRRKGSLPLLRFPAHSSKIYGIDWSHSSPSELVTCSLDKTIKVWDISVLPSSSSGSHFLALCTPSSIVPPLSTPAMSNGRFFNTPTDTVEPKVVVNTRYPVWRARNLPFGRGILSLAQRGETALEMYARAGLSGNEILEPVERFEGHTDVVKEFVWRRAPGVGLDGSDHQLITWSKDRTLRFWPIDSDLMQRVGWTPPRSATATPQTPTAASALTQSSISFRSPPTGTTYPSIASGPRSILDEVRSPWPPTPGASNAHSTNGAYPRPMPQRQATNLVMQPHIGSAARGSVLEQMMSDAIRKTLDPRDKRDQRDHQVGTAATVTATGGTDSPRPPPMISGSGGAGETMVPVAGSQHQGGTMSRGGMGAATRLDALTWLSNVKVGVTQPPQLGAETEDGGIEPEVGTMTAGNTMSLVRHMQQPSASTMKTTSIMSRVSSREGSGSLLRKGRNDASGSRDRKEKEKEKDDTGQTLQDEITSVLTKLASSKIKLEKHDLLKKRTCTLGLHGPWGENSSVFMRVSFTFPRDYPHAEYPQGTPTIDIERNPLIAIQKRAFISRHLRVIREKKRPCLEACLRFLLFASEEDSDQQGEDSSSDDALPGMRRRRSISSDDDDDEGLIGRKDFTVSLLRNNKNLAEPRTSQGTFGPNGELVCFFRAPPRFVGAVPRNVQDSPEKPYTESEVSTTTTTPAEGSTPAGGATTALPSVPPLSSLSSTTSTSTPEMPPTPKPLQPPALVSDAIRRLSMAAKDRIAKPGEARRVDQTEHITKVMTNLLTFSQIGGLGSGLELRREPETSSRRFGLDVNHFGAPDMDQIYSVVGGLGGIGTGGSIVFPGGSSIRSGKRQSIIGTEIIHSGKSYLLPTRRSTVFITRTTDIAGADRKVAVEYVAMLDDNKGGLLGVCEKNLKVSQDFGRYDHERVWMMLKTLFEIKRGSANENHTEKLDEKLNKSLKRSSRDAAVGFMENEVGIKMVMKLLEDFAKCKDIQMLALLSTVLLQAIALCPSPQPNNHPNPNNKHRKPLQHFSHSVHVAEVTSPQATNGTNTPQNTITISASRSPAPPPIKPLPNSMNLNLPVMPKGSKMDYFAISRAINGQAVPDSSNLTLPPSLFHGPMPQQMTTAPRRAIGSLGSAPQGVNSKSSQTSSNRMSHPALPHLSNTSNNSNTLAPTPTPSYFPQSTQGQLQPGTAKQPHPQVHAFPTITAPPAVTQSNSSTSRASWSSLFGAGAESVRNLMGTLTTTTTPTSEVPPGLGGGNDAGGGYFTTVAAHLTGLGDGPGGSTTNAGGPVVAVEMERSGNTSGSSGSPATTAAAHSSRGGGARRGRGLVRTASMIGLALTRSSDGREGSGSTSPSSTTVGSGGTGSTASTVGGTAGNEALLYPTSGTGIGASDGPTVTGHHGGKRRHGRKDGSGQSQGGGQPDGANYPSVERNGQGGGSSWGNGSPTNAGVVSGLDASGQAKPGATTGSRSWSEVVHGRPSSSHGHEHGHRHGHGGHGQKHHDPRTGPNPPRRGPKGHTSTNQTPSPIPHPQQLPASRQKGGTATSSAAPAGTGPANTKGNQPARVRLHLTHNKAQTPSQKRKTLFFDSPSYAEKNEMLSMTLGRRLFSTAQIQQFISHVYVYAEMLFSWQLYQKRVELLKSVWRVWEELKKQDIVVDGLAGVLYRAGGDEVDASLRVDETAQSHLFGLWRTCTRCGQQLQERGNACSTCTNQSTMAHCSICRLPVKGLSRSCFKCQHISHILCWNALNVPICPTGCGCFCNGLSMDDQEPADQQAQQQQQQEQEQQYPSNSIGSGGEEADQRDGDDVEDDLELDQDQDQIRGYQNQGAITRGRPSQIYLTRYS